MSDVVGARHGAAFSRRDAPGALHDLSLETWEGAGKAGYPEHPQPVRKGRKHTVVTTGPPEHPAFPAQWF